jgi:hypothetical protein
MTAAAATDIPERGGNDDAPFCTTGQVELVKPTSASSSRLRCVAVAFSVSFTPLIRCKLGGAGALSSSASFEPSFDG